MKAFADANHGIQIRKRMPGSQFIVVMSAVLLTCVLSVTVKGDDEQPLVIDGVEVIARPELHKPLTEPPCSYCIEQHQKGLVKSDDRVLAWIRGAHNGGAFPLRHFISVPRVVNDTYGLFFYDADGGYVSAFRKDYGYSFYGWRGGVMVVKGPDGTLWSALSGRAIHGPRTGDRLERVPSLLTDWGHWLLLHPESTAYDLFDGDRYPVGSLKDAFSSEALESIGKVDPRLSRFAPVLGLEAGEARMAFRLEGLDDRSCIQTHVGATPVAVFYYGPTHSATAFEARIDGRELTFYADEISPLTAPFKDRETGTRWTLAGRGIDGPLRGRELKWMPSLQCRWYAWSFEFPDTELYKPTGGER